MDLTSIIRRIVEAIVLPRLDYSALYPSVVVKQVGLTVEILPDAEAARGLGLTEVPIRHGLPGATVTVMPGARVLLGFDEQSPGKPYVALWDTAAPFVTMTIGGLAVTPQGAVMGAGAGALAADDSGTATTGAGSDFVAMSTLVSSQLSAIKSAIAGAAVVPMDGGAAFKANILLALAAFPGPVASTNLKAD